jgi:hypothetical protein
VPLFPLAIREPSERQEIGTGKEADTILEPEAHPCLETLGNSVETESLQALAHPLRSPFRQSTLYLTESAAAEPATRAILPATTDAKRRRTRSLLPGATRSGCKPHAVPPL